MDFICIGFDVRQWPWSGEYNVDDTGWERNESCYEDIKSVFCLKENEYELLEISDQSLLSRISEYVAMKGECNLVAIELPTDVVKLQDAKYGFSTASNKIRLSNFVCHGYDVCDFNGLFSVLHNPLIRRDGSSKLIPESAMLEALELVQIANVLDPGHSPFVVAKVHSLCLTCLP